MVKKTYTSFAELREDFSWFIHNCLTVTAGKIKKDAEKGAKRLLNLIDDEIYNLLLCSKCYENAYKRPDESVACDPPHILLWVDCKVYGYWPAKLMRCVDDHNVTVRYFGDYSNDTIDAGNCLMFSNTAPKNEHGPAKGSSFELAMKVIKCRVRSSFDELFQLILIYIIHAL